MQYNTILKRIEPWTGMNEDMKIACLRNFKDYKIQHIIIRYLFCILVFHLPITDQLQWKLENKTTNRTNCKLQMK